MGVCMVAASHQFCLGLFVPLPGNPQSICLEWLMCPGTISPCCSGTYIAGGNMSSGKHGVSQGRHVAMEEAGFLARNIHPACWSPVIPAVHQGQSSSELQTASHIALPLSCYF